MRSVETWLVNQYYLVLSRSIGRSDGRLFLMGSLVLMLV